MLRCLSIMKNLQHTYKIMLLKWVNTRDSQLERFNIDLSWIYIYMNIINDKFEIGVTRYQVCIKFQLSFEKMHIWKVDTHHYYLIPHTPKIKMINLLGPLRNKLQGKFLKLFFRTYRISKCNHLDKFLVSKPF